MPFLPPNQQRQSTEGQKHVTFCGNAMINDIQKSDSEIVSFKDTFDIFTFLNDVPFHRFSAISVMQGS